jgi:tetratricopeptide (TPR) repeat protein
MSRNERDAGNIIQHEVKLDERAILCEKSRSNRAEDRTSDLATRLKAKKYYIRILNSTLSKAIVAFLLLTWCLHGCKYLRPREVCTDVYDPNKPLKEAYIEDNLNLHRGRWWNYYELGSCLLASGHYEEAIKKLDIAIQKRDHDKRDTRTYGMHFVDYFPHRESGVAYCLWAEEEKRDMAEKEKRFKNAISELETSIKQEPSSKAKFYLKRATEGFWSVAKDDIMPPLVWIQNEEIDHWKNVPTLYMNGYSIALEIRASDDKSGIGKVWIDSVVNKERKDRRELFIESAEKTFPEKTLPQKTIVTVNPNNKEETLEIHAIDLAGNSSRPAVLKLIVDTVPPMTSIEVRSDIAALKNERVLLDVIAVDDEGLKSVRVGEDPYSHRDCRGRDRWKGTFSLRYDISNVDVEVVDLAGNISAMNVALERKWPTSIRADSPLLAANVPFSLNHILRNGALDAAHYEYRNIISRPGQFSTLEIQSFPSLLGHESVHEAALTEHKSPELLLSDVADNNTLVSTSHPRYLLQGQVKNADGLEYISITVDGKAFKMIMMDGGWRGGEKVMRHDEHVIFSTWVPLPEVNDPNFDESLSINVNAHFVGQVSDPNEVSLRVQRVSNCLLEPKSKYSVVLLPLEGKRTGRRQYKRWDQANQIVCEAVKGYIDHEPKCGQFHQRFNCQHLNNWKAIDFNQKIENYFKGEDIKEPQNIAMKAAQIAASKEWHSDLAIYGSFEDENDIFFDVKVHFTDVQISPFSNKVIDMYGSYEERDYYIEGLISKLKAFMPRVNGEIISTNPKEDTIEVDLGNEYHVFNDMDLLLYEVSGPRENPRYNMSCEAKANVVGDVSVSHVSARIVKCQSGTNRASIMKKWKEVHVISK